MHSRLLRGLIFTLSSLILSQVVMGSGVSGDSGDSGDSCLRSSPTRDGQTRVTFLREDAWGARSLYLSDWSADRRLVSCEVTSSPLATESYLTLCGRTDTRLQEEELTRRFNFSVLAAADSPCAPVSSSGAPRLSRRTRGTGTGGKVRRKRGWIFPGTLWCGRGSQAVRYEQLGMFENADRCCREHDHCSHIISSFTMNYGVFNSYFYTLSHCDCDQRFRQCLLEVNDTISSMVHYSFFNILRIPCFELKQQKRCTQMYWWGMCKVAKEAPYAIFKSPLPNNTSDVSIKYGDSATRSSLTSSERQHVTQSPATTLYRKSLKINHRCGPRVPPRGDTFHLTTKGRRCKTSRILSTVAPSQMAPISRARTTTPSMGKTKLITVVSDKKRVGKKKSNRKGLLVSTTQRRQVPKQASTNSYPRISSTTQSSLTVTRRQQLYSTAAATAETKTKKSHKKGRKQSRCCGFRRADTLRTLCKHCLEKETTTAGPPFKVPILQTPQHTETTDTPKPDNLKMQLNTTTFATPIRMKPKTTASLRKDGESLRQMDSHLLGNNTSQRHMGSNTTQSTLVGISFKENNAVTDSQLLCGSLRALDDCKYQIPPLEKKYDLQNMESKTAYHCDCTTRLALQIKSFKQPRVLPMLLMDFISQYCFKLPKENKCRHRKSCSGGFIKASDLLRTLKKMEAKDSGGVQNSGNERKRGIPVRLYKRCLRLQREADIMAQLT